MALANQKQPPLAPSGGGNAPQVPAVSEQPPRTGPTPPAVPSDQPQTIQHPPQPSKLGKFMAEGQDAKMIAKLHERVTGICTSQELIEYMAVQQRPAVNLSPDAVVVTNRRVIIFRQKMLGRMDMVDLPWINCHDVRIKEGVIGASLFVTGRNGHSESVEWLPKDQARKVYRIAQEMEEQMVEHRRERSMEESRAGATNIVVNSATPQAAPEPSAPTNTPGDPMAKLSQLKQLHEAGMITDEEFAAKKAAILEQL